MREKLEGDVNNRKEHLAEAERRLIEKARGHFRTVKEEIERVEWRIEEYATDPSDENWKAMVEELGLLASLQTTPPLLTTDLDHARNAGNAEGGWPSGTRTWRK